MEPYGSWGHDGRLTNHNGRRWRHRHGVAVPIARGDGAPTTLQINV
jgi:hypothetical protein